MFAILPLYRMLRLDVLCLSLAHSDLELAVENLSELLEAPFDGETIPELRAKTTDKTVYVQKRHRIMLEDTLEGYAEDRWQWQVAV